jgi:hypothetical protein
VPRQNEDEGERILIVGDVMNFQAFQTSAALDTPPPGLSPLLLALWYAGKGDWNKAHELAQSQDDSQGAWVHAYLHRVEGDLGNAAYWYRQAGKAVPNIAVTVEWAEIVIEMLKE